MNDSIRYWNSRSFSFMKNLSLSIKNVMRKIRNWIWSLHQSCILSSLRLRMPIWSDWLIYWGMVYPGVVPGIPTLIHQLLNIFIFIGFLEEEYFTWETLRESFLDPIKPWVMMILYLALSFGTLLSLYTKFLPSWRECKLQSLEGHWGCHI